MATPKLEPGEVYLAGQILQPTDDWLERVRQYHAGEIDDDRVICKNCAKRFYGRHGGGCSEGIGFIDTIRRRCIRYTAKKTPRPR